METRHCNLLSFTHMFVFTQFRIAKHYVSAPKSSLCEPPRVFSHIFVAQIFWLTDIINNNNNNYHPIETSSDIIF